jgi:hypothetical protein
MGLEPPPQNVREGHVLKPVNPHYIRQDAAVLKEKNDKFSEKASVRKKGTVVVVEASEEVKAAVEEASLLVTQQRYDNVVSKYGTINIGKLIGALTQDVYNEFYKDRKKRFSGTDKKMFNKAMTSACRKLILTNR